MSRPVWVWGLPLSPMTRRETASAVMALIDGGGPSFFITANTHHAMLTAERPELRAINERAAFLVADGAPLVWASRRAGTRLPERVAGSDLIYDLCEQAALRGKLIYLLGGSDGIAVEAIAGTACPQPGSLAGDGLARIVADIRAAKPDLLLVAFGQPKGEIWLSENLEKLGVPVAVQVGATLDFVAGKVRRAPRLFQQLGMEWAYRIYTDPARLAPRYARNARFLFERLARELISGPAHPGGA